MTCETVRLGDGTTAIVCSRSKRPRCVGCGNPASLECDWRVKTRRSGTCDRPLCAACTHSPAPDKDLCPEHAAIWLRDPRSRPANPTTAGAPA